MSKMALYEPFGHLQHELWQKERPKVKLTIWLPTIKSREIDPTPVCENGVRHTVGNLSRRATNLLQTLSQSEVWTKSYEFTKSRESKLGQFRDSPLGVPGQKAIRMWVPWNNTENTIWGKVVASPESGPWWVMWVQSCPWLVLAPRVLQNTN
jgi:hypothetical protein